MKDKIYIFGTGSVSEYIFDKIDLNKVEVLGFVRSIVDDTERFHDLPVKSIDSIKESDFDYILLGSGYVKKIQADLLQSGIHADKFVSFIYDDCESYKEIKGKIDEYLNQKYNRSLIYKWLKVDASVSSIYPSVLWKDDLCIDSYEKDFVREQTVKLISDQINSKLINGDVAELGVFRGDFTVVISRLFPNRTLYLYDTFEGFSQNDVSDDSTIRNKKGELSKFKDTSVEFVINRLSRDTGVVVKKGYFPDSFSEHNVNFCFVSIDLNLYKPVLDALELFYPLICSGGYILISDYYAPFYSGTKDAVDEFCRIHNKTIIPVSDFYGSALLIKE